MADIRPDHITKRFGGNEPTVKDVSLDVDNGDLRDLVGPPGLMGSASTMSRAPTSACGSTHSGCTCSTQGAASLTLTPQPGRQRGA